MPRVLFFPWGYGGGAGYTARCLSLAETLRHHGWDAAFAGCGANSLVRAAGLPLLEQRTTPSAEHPRVPAYLPFLNVERVWAVAARYYRADRFDEQLREDERLITDYRPDAVVIDMTPTAAIAARKHCVPVISMADADFLSPLPNAWMPWTDVPPGQLMPFPSAGEVVLDRARRIAGLDVEFPNDVLWGMSPSSRPPVPSIRCRPGPGRGARCAGSDRCRGIRLRRSSSSRTGRVRISTSRSAAGASSGGCASGHPRRM